MRHPCPEIPQGLVDKVVGRRGRLHQHETIDPARTALVVVDLDQGSCDRDERTAAALPRVNAVAAALRAAGGRVAFVTSRVVDVAGLAGSIGWDLARGYEAETAPGGIGTRLAAGLDVSPDDLHAVKLGASAFFPGKCDLHEQLQSLGIGAIFVAGLVTNVCVEASARDACELGYAVTLVSDACVGHSYGLHEATLATFFRICGDVRPTADVLTLLGGGAADEPASPSAVRALGVAHRASAADLWDRCGLTRPWNPPADDFDRALVGPTSAVLGVVEGDDVVGTVMVGHDGHRGWVYYLAVDPERRRGGLGRSLMAAAEAWLRERGAVKLNLMVRNGNEEVLGFYARLGYDAASTPVLARWLDGRD